MRFRTFIGRSTESVLLLALMAAVSASGWAQRETAGSTFESDPTGMYSFLHEGEFVQITIDDWNAPEGKETFNVSGFVSRYGDESSDKDQFLDQFFSKGTLKGDGLTFSTKQVHGTWFDFQGEIHRGDAKSRAEEGFYVVKGTLTENRLREGRTTARQREITMKMFPDEEDQ